MTSKYDPDILQEYADRLYKQARHVVAWDTIIGLVVGFFVGFVLIQITMARMPPGQSSGNPGAILLIALLIGAGLGYAVGSRRAFSFRLEAQRTLVQVQIEHNTRPQVAPVETFTAEKGASTTWTSAPK